MQHWHALPDYFDEIFFLTEQGGVTLVCIIERKKKPNDPLRNKKGRKNKVLN